MKTIHDKLSQVAPSLNNGENISSGVNCLKKMA